MKKKRGVAISYGKLLKVSWEDVTKHWILLVPNLLAIAVTVLLTILFLRITGIWDFVRINPGMLFTAVTTDYFVGIFEQGAPFIVLYFLMQFMIDIFFVVMKYGMIRDVLMKGKTSMQSGIEFAIKHYFHVFGVYFASFLMLFIPVLSVAYVLLLLGRMTGILSSFMGLAVVILFAFLALTYVLLVSYRLLFLYPVTTFESTGVFSSMHDDFHYVKTHTGHTLVSTLIVLAFIILYAGMWVPFRATAAFIQNTYLLLGISIAILFIEILVSTWEHVFLFDAYLTGKKTVKRA